MNEFEALHSFVSGFGVQAYCETSVPDSAAFPYITYEPSFGAWGEESNVQVKLWGKGSEKQLNDIVKSISTSLGLGGKTIKTTTGGIWLRKGSPFAQAFTSTEDVKARLINITVENLSE